MLSVGMGRGGGSATISSLENMLHHGFWSDVFHVHFQRGKRDADMDCMCRWSFRLEVALDTVVHESCKTSCDYYSKGLVRYKLLGMLDVDSNSLCDIR